ncbi:hypothetical protein [Sulfurifustis variabilis]|uniref:hypothetical protein n=1 Tax=Sulfurifustis variabilis TaxID=1675686 RepID=UPI0011E4D303|nr:hypothetical protein [Sulfurifustis variabilis]
MAEAIFDLSEYLADWGVPHHALPCRVWTEPIPNGSTGGIPFFPKKQEGTKTGANKPVRDQCLLSRRLKLTDSVSE